MESRTGLVSLKNLRFNVKLLNELLQGMPFQIVSAEVAELQATISYDTLLADGCNLTVRGCKVVFTPVDPPSASSSTSAAGHKKHPASSNSSKAPSSFTPETERSDPSRHSGGEEDDPLLFIAQWIEVVIARLQCTVEDLEVILVSHAQLASQFSGKGGSPLPAHARQASAEEAAAAASVHFLFDTISFYNTHPKMLQADGNSSTLASTSHILGGSQEHGGESSSFMDPVDISLLSFRKLLSVKSIRVEVQTHHLHHSPFPSSDASASSFSASASATGGFLPLLHFTEGGQIEMMLQPPPQHRRSTYVNHAQGAGGGGGHSHSHSSHSHTQSLAHNQAALDMEITFPKLVCNLQASQVGAVLCCIAQ